MKSSTRVAEGFMVTGEELVTVAGMGLLSHVFASVHMLTFTGWCPSINHCLVPTILKRHLVAQT